MDLDHPVVLRLSPKAQDFLQILHNLEYLTPEISQKLYAQLLRLPPRHTLIQLEEIRRHCALILFDHKKQINQRTLLFLKQDWPILFR